MSDIQLQPVKSSNIAAAGYDPASQTLVVQFASGKKYRYPNVSQFTWDEFAGTFAGDLGKSAGKYFAANLRTLPCEQIIDEE